MKQKTTIRIISLIPAIILLLTITFLFKTNYADNNLFRFTHIISSKDKISLSQAQKSAAESEQKSFICNIEKPTDSETFLELLTYLKKSGAKRIIIEGNTNLISQYNKIDEINNLFSANPELFIETLQWDKNKSAVSHNLDTNINCLFSKIRFPLAHTAATQPVSNLFYAKKIHFCPYTENTQIMQDFLFKLDKKHVITLPVALYAAKYNIKLSELNFEQNKIQIGSKTFYYDDMARFAFKRGFVPHKKAEVFSISNKEEIDVSDAFVFITGSNMKYSESGNYKWISVVLGQLKLLENADSMIFLPIYISFLLSLVMFALMFCLTIWINSILQIFLVLCSCFFGNFTLYFFTANFWNLNYPLAGCTFAAITGFVCGLVTLFCNKKLWQFEIFRIFKHSISVTLRKKIADNITDNNLELSSAYIETAFIQCEISNLPSNNTESEEYLIHKNEICDKIENIIRKNNGVVSFPICGYFSRLFNGEQYISDIKNTLSQINQRAFKKNLTTALHCNNEYFGYTKSLYDEKKTFDVYKPLGNSQNITSKMLKYAKKFGIKTILSESMLKAIKSFDSEKKLFVRPIDRIRIKNTTFSERLFELINDEDFKQKERILEHFHAGLKSFEQRKWKEAGEHFSQCLKIDKTDIPSAIYLQRCKNFILTSPKEDWNGVYEID